MVESVGLVVSRKPKKTSGAAPPREPGDVDALAELGPFSKALASVATREEPAQAGASPELVAAAYVLRATWLALQRGDRAALHEWAKAANRYLEKNPTQGVETIVCKFFVLPPIVGVTRADAVRDLLFRAKLALDADCDAAQLAASMECAIADTFPHLLPSVPPRGRVTVDKIAAAIQELRKITPRQVVVCTLSALGMADTEIASALKSVGE